VTRTAPVETGVGTPERKRAGLFLSPTAGSSEEFNPKVVTPEDYRKRGGLTRAHTWTPGVPLTPVLATQLKRRLSIAHDPDKPYVLDGIPDATSPRKEVNTKRPSSIIAQYASYSHVGLIPFNQDKVNQDRVIALAPFEASERGLFGVFDGHGSNGHEVSAFLSAELPKCLSQELEKMKKKI